MTGLVTHSTSAGCLHARNRAAVPGGGTIATTDNVCLVAKHSLGRTTSFFHSATGQTFPEVALREEDAAFSRPQ